jgi:hypothetical protein
MIKNAGLFLLVLVLLTSAAVICTAQPFPGDFPGTVPDVGPSYPPDGQVPNWPGIPEGFPGTGPDVGPSNPFGGQTPEGPGSQSGGSSPEHPTEGPQVTIPTYTPSANTGNVLGNLENGQTLDTQSTIAAFGSEPQPSSDGGSTQPDRGIKPGLVFAAPPPPPNGIQIWVFYNNRWTQGPSAVSLYNQMNIAVINGQTQFLWGYDSNSWQRWSSWGLRWPATMFSTFFGDVRGWHSVAMWGSNTGWSNVLLIYVR